MNLFFVDYLIMTLALFGAIVGIFVGFSGTLAFVIATVCGIAASRACWVFSVGTIASGWPRAVATGLAALLIFGLVRWLVRKVVNGLLHQPADAIFGFIVSGSATLALSLLIAFMIRQYLGLEFDSGLLLEVADGIRILFG